VTQPTPANQDATLIEISVVSDIMCPWCYIGKRHLDAALSAFDGPQVRVRWLPFQLDPTLPAQGRDRQTYLSTKFGGAEKAAAIYARVGAAGRDAGLDFDFDSIAVSPNTFDMHCLITGIGEHPTHNATQGALVETLFDHYFCRGTNLADRENVMTIVEELNWCKEDAAALIEDEAIRQKTTRLLASVHNARITGVPCFILVKRTVLQGAQPPEQIQNALHDIATQRFVS